MTSDDLKVKPGDRVLVECEAIRLASAPADRRCFVFDGDGPVFRALRIHSVLPRPISVGDRVIVEDADAGVVQWRDEHWALVRFDGTPFNVSPMVAMIDTLTRVESSDE